MKTMSRVQFLAMGNVVWLTQFAVEFVLPFFPDNVAWWQTQPPELRIGCYCDSYMSSPVDRLFILALYWLMFTPLMNVIAWRNPEQWPAKLSRLWWNEAEGARSWLTALAVFGVLLWPVTGLLNAHTLSTIALEGTRTLLLFGALAYYRAVTLNA